jgi:uncharacterized protein YycO
VKLAFYRGKSFISQLIKWQTFGEYSHVGVVLRDDSIVEAWHVGGVLRNPSISSAHTPGTVVDLYDIPDLQPDVEGRIEYLLLQQVGCGYDFRGVLRFLTRAGLQDAHPNKWFCSELASYAFRACGFPLLRKDIPPFKVSPFGLSSSPLIEFRESRITK